jgi:uncharacterized surface protein with fasciclin (FAS1) repeats
MKNIIETAVGNPDFSTLVTAIKKAQLVDTLAGSGPFTVFAPTNAAFAKIPKETLDTVLNDEAKPKSILMYHVLDGTVLASDATTITEAKTLEGSMVTIKSELPTTAGETSKAPALMVNDAHILTADIQCSNGVIHSLDTVLMP